MSLHKGTTLSSSLDKIPKLESSSGWVNWKAEIIDQLGIGGYGDLLSRNKHKPEQGILSIDVHAQRVEAWQQRQDIACSIIRRACGNTATALLNEKMEAKTLNEQAKAFMAALEERFKPTGTVVFQRLHDTYLETTLASSKGGVTEYATELRRARDDLGKLHKSLVIPEPLLVNRFLKGLGLNFNQFCSSIHQMWELLPATEGDAPKTNYLTFEHAVLLAEKAENSLKHAQPQEQPVVLATYHKQRNPSKRPRGSGDECNTCKKMGRRSYFHTEDQCYILYPEKKEAIMAEIAQRRKRRETECPKGDTPGPSANILFVPPTNIGFHAFVQYQRPTIAATTSRNSPLLKNWILDTGANFHVSCNKGFFIKDTLRAHKGKSISGYGGLTNAPKLIGTAMIPCRSGNSVVCITLKDCLYDLKAACNVVSYNLLHKAGASFKLIDNGFEIATSMGPVQCLANHVLYWFLLI